MFQPAVSTNLEVASALPFTNPRSLGSATEILDLARPRAIEVETGGKRG